MTIEIPDTLALSLQNHASRCGVTVEDYVNSLLNSGTTDQEMQSLDDLNYEAWRERLAAFQRNRRTDLPILTEESISREAIYEGR